MIRTIKLFFSILLILVAGCAGISEKDDYSFIKDSEYIVIYSDDLGGDDTYLYFYDESYEEIGMIKSKESYFWRSKRIGEKIYMFGSFGTIAEIDLLKSTFRIIKVEDEGEVNNIDYYSGSGIFLENFGFYDGINYKTGLCEYEGDITIESCKGYDKQFSDFVMGKEYSYALSLLENENQVTVFKFDHDLKIIGTVCLDYCFKILRVNDEIFFYCKDSYLDEDLNIIPIADMSDDYESAITNGEIVLRLDYGGNGTVRVDHIDLEYKLRTVKEEFPDFKRLYSVNDTFISQTAELIAVDQDGNRRFVILDVSTMTGTELPIEDHTFHNLKIQGFYKVND